jgi:hypothetical protein
LQDRIGPVPIARIHQAVPKAMQKGRFACDGLCRTAKAAFIQLNPALQSENTPIVFPLWQGGLRGIFLLKQSLATHHAD